jgi:hypothetical protein
MALKIRNFAVPPPSNPLRFHAHPNLEPSAPCHHEGLRAPSVSPCETPKKNSKGLLPLIPDLQPPKLPE